MYGRALGVREGHRTMSLARWAREQAIMNRGNPRVRVSEGGGKLRGVGITRKRKRRGKRG